MAAAQDKPEPASAHANRRVIDDEKNDASSGDIRETLVEVSAENQLLRHLGNRQIQLIAIGGSIGTALFVSIGGGLAKGGPGSLLIGYTIYAIMVGMVNNSMAEMVTYMPVSGSFIRMAGRWVDEALGFMAGWNFFLYEACLIPFEISAINLVLGFWRDDIPPAAICVACIVLYAIINIMAVQYFGEAEFWLSSGKILLICILYMFTLVTMCGGNPQHDAYGFRYWSDPGSFAEHIHTGTLGRFEGFLGAVFSAGFTVVGPEYLAMVAGEAERPRTYLKNGFKTVYWRFGVFFIGGALCVGIVLPYADPTLQNADTGTANGSPYVIAMQNMGIGILPHIVNALMITSIFSAGNAYTYCAMRSLYGLACDGQAPKIFQKTLKNGIPVYAFALVMVFPFLSFLQVSNNTAQVVTWLATLTQGSQMINYIVMSLTYIFFYNATKAQGIDRRSLPYYGYFQPYCGYIGMAWMVIIEGIFGYSVFLPGKFNVGDFFAFYTMAMVAFCTFFGWKIYRRTKFVAPAQADLVWEKPAIDAYEASHNEPPTRFRDEIRAMFFGNRKRENYMGEDPN
ncbi:amino acid permease/ SLC12A domain-containing protein [Annulohypoxylon maeteangense]|uniref:amino acid permease/ SLC12A domain-containing protein n=1 Tax=Annulohypoxylon maeteangense TaxID=1927788 RepID=UPI002008D7C6|nr:amino acid permease/ SLC12A domain-containing protein [Annulohypoxylon maeteangense]KAI0880484.1 amino acid permease/ SLC12A domain-containing protein [Annulohypoxylon maeteangense]